MSVNGSIIGPDNPTGVYQASGVWSLSEASEAVGAGQWPGVTDPHFSSVSLLMSFDSDFSNAGGYSGSFSAVNSAAVSSAQTKFGAKSLDIDTGSQGVGAGPFLTTSPGSALSQSGEYTEEVWLYPVVLSGPGDMVFGGYKQTAGALNFAMTTAGRLCVQKYGTGKILNGSSVTCVAGEWQHVALTRDSDNLVRVFRNGVVDSTTVTEAANVTASVAFNLGSGGTAGYGIRAFIDEYRRTEGVCRYTENFAPPITTFPTS
tara:strand:- start:2340 stop:3119 length:780 start_codon:yes stop_codon:yes gene_type:complete